MEYKSPEEIFPLMKDEVNSRIAEKVYRFIINNFEEVEIFSLKSCISLAKRGSNNRKFATISQEEGNALLLHFPLKLRDKVSSESVKFERSKRYRNQINIKLENISEVEKLYDLIRLAYSNPRKKASE